MAVIGLVISIVNFLLFYLFLESIIKSPFLSFIFSVSALAAMGVTAVGYDKSYKISKNNVKTLRDRLKLFTACLLSFLVLIVTYHVFFNRQGLMPLLHALPYVLAVLFICCLAGFLTIRYKMRKARRKEAENSYSDTRNSAQMKFCPVCGGKINNSQKYCSNCGIQL